jgi:hypothetical protein
MRGCRHLRMVFAAAVLLMVGTGIGRLPAEAQDGPGSITVTVYNCPPDMTRDSLVAEECEPTTEDFAIDINFGFGADARTVTLADAAFDGQTYVWSGLPVAPGPVWGAPGDPYLYRIVETELPPGYADYVVAGSEARGDKDGLETRFTVRLIPDAPDASLTIYNFVEPPPPLEPATVEIYAAICPPGFAGDDHEDYEATCEDDPNVGAEFTAARPGEEPLFRYVFYSQVVGEDGLFEFTVERSLLRGSVYVGEGLHYDPDVVEVVVVCVDATDNPIDAEVISFKRGGSAIAEIQVRPGDAIRCDWFNVPEAP